MIGDLLKTLDGIDAFRRKRNTDWVCLLVGQPGTGKSNLGGACGTYLYEKMDLQFPASQVALNAQEALSLFKNTVRYGVVLYDEGMRSLMGRRAMSTENVEQLSAFAQLRQNKNLIIFLAVQDLALIEKPIRSRANMILKCVFSKGRDGMPTQGKFYAYGPRASRRIYVDGAGQTHWPRENYTDMAPDISGLPFWKELTARTDMQKHNSIQESLNKVMNKGKPKTTRDKTKDAQIEQFIKQELTDSSQTLRAIASKATSNFGVVISKNRVHRIKGKPKN
jgi:hypothetical protein